MSGKPRQGSPVPDAGRTRRAVERHSAPLLLHIRRLPRWLVALGPLALLLAGLAAPGPFGSAALIALAVLLAWLGYVSWPSLRAPGRVLRLLAVGTLLALAVLTSLGQI